MYHVATEEQKSVIQASPRDLNSSEFDSWAIKIKDLSKTLEETVMASLARLEACDREAAERQEAERDRVNAVQEPKLKRRRLSEKSTNISAVYDRLQDLGLLKAFEEPAPKNQLRIDAMFK
jgi:hypothetical protein